MVIHLLFIPTVQVFCVL